MGLKRILVLGYFAAVLTGLSAQEAQQEKLSLSLADAKSYALKHNRKIQMSDLSVQKAEAAKWQAIATMLPHVDATLSYANTLGYEMKFKLNGMEIASPVDPTGNLNIKATMAFSGMQIVAVQLGKLAIDMSKISYNISELDTKATATSAYFSVLVAEESKRIMESSRGNLERLYQSTSKLYEVGMAEQTDADQIEVQLGVLDNNIKTAERNIELAYNALRLVLGSDETSVELTETLDGFMANNDVYAAAISEFDINGNYNVQLLDQNIELSKKQLNMKRWEYGPTLALFYQYAGIKYFGEEPMMNSTIPNTVGATLNIPIFSSGERLSKVRQAKFDVKTAELTKEDAVEGLLVQEKQLRFLLHSAIETYELQKKNVAVSERIFKNTVQKYELGIVSSTDLTTINNNLLTAQGSYISALMELLTAQVNLQKLLNQL